MVSAGGFKFMPQIYTFEYAECPIPYLIISKRLLLYRTVRGPLYNFRLDVVRFLLKQGYHYSYRS